LIAASTEVHSAWAVVQNLSNRVLEDKVTEPDDPDSAPASEETQEETALPTVCPSCAAAEFRGAARAEMAVDHNILVSDAISEDVTALSKGREAESGEVRIVPFHRDSGGHSSQHTAD